NPTDADAGDRPTPPPRPAVPPHAASRTSASAALDAERQAIGEHLRKSARVDTSLHLGHVIRRTIEGDGPGVGVEHGVRRPRIAVAWLPDTTGVDERPLFEAVRLSRRDARRFRAVRAASKEGRDVR